MLMMLARESATMLQTFANWPAHMKGKRQRLVPTSEPDSELFTLADAECHTRCICDRDSNTSHAAILDQTLVDDST